jgi:EAL domain-containing protein (putative c-di-GMP-specific phosphodiesterase class I)
MLEDIGADIGQGYFIARPLTSVQLDNFLSSSHRSGDLAPLVPVTIGR